MGNLHSDCEGYDPRGTKDRRWICRRCGKIATLDKLMRDDCTAPPMSTKEMDGALLTAIGGGQREEPEDAP